MRLHERSKRTLYVRARSARRGSWGEPVILWGEPVMIRAACQPTTNKLGGDVYSSRLTSSIHGQRIRRMYTILYDGLVAVREGDGLCIHTAAQDEPDYQVISVRGWGHQVIEAEAMDEHGRD